MALSITRGKKPSDVFYSNAEAFRQIPINKLQFLFDFSMTYTITRKPLYGELVEELAKKLDSTYAIAMPSIWFISLIIKRFQLVTREELINDLNQLEFNKDMIDKILDFLDKNEDLLNKFAEGTRNEAVPSLVDINWRVDIRHSSGDFLKEPSVYALLRLQVYDGEQLGKIYFELDKDRLSWLETTINKIKSKFIEAEKIKNEIFSSEKS